MDFVSETCLSADLGLVRERYLEQKTARDLLLSVYCEFGHQLPELNAELCIIYACREGACLWFSVCERDLLESLDLTQLDSFELARAALERLNIAIHSTHEGLRLRSIDIPKPWGKEVWYTGIEERGVSKVGMRGQAYLPWVMLASPFHYGCEPEDLILLKELVPLPEPVYGDLYLELHEKKREVYIVTAVDRTAWPDGMGRIRLGFDSNKRQQFDTFDDFKNAFRVALLRYRKVRQQIDDRLDEFRRASSIPLDAPVAPSVLKSWLEQVDTALVSDEQRLRHDVESFTAMVPVSVGDVIKVPCHTPHSLQHGVSSIEFQTPVYERKILAFAQKVLTQVHWDIDEALDLSLDAHYQPEAFQTEQWCGTVASKIVTFEDFSVYRIELNHGDLLQLPDDADYWVLMVLSGALDVRSEQAAHNGYKQGEAILQASSALNPLTYQVSDAVDCAVILCARPH